MQLYESRIALPRLHPRGARVLVCVCSIVAGNLLQVVVSLVLSTHYIFFADTPCTMHRCSLLMRCCFLSCTVSDSSFSLASALCTAGII
jgi:hypothetical protein